MCSIGFQSGLQFGLLLRLNTAIRSKLTSNSCKSGYLVHLKSEYQTL